MQPPPSQRRSILRRLSRFWENLRCQKTYDRDFNLPHPSERISDIETSQFNQFIDNLRAAGWKKVIEYDAFDAWVDHGLLVLNRQNKFIKCSWTNWSEGTIEGPQDVIEQLRRSVQRIGETGIQTT